MQHSLAIHDDECIAFEHFQLTELCVHTNFEWINPTAMWSIEAQIDSFVYREHLL